MLSIVTRCYPQNTQQFVTRTHSFTLSMEDPTPHMPRPGTLSLRNSLAPTAMNVLFDSQLLYSHNYKTSFKKLTRTTIYFKSGVNARGIYLSQKSLT